MYEADVDMDVVVMGSEFGMLVFIGSKFGNWGAYHAPMWVIWWSGYLILVIFMTCGLPTMRIIGQILR